MDTNLASRMTMDDETIISDYSNHTNNRSAAPFVSERLQVFQNVPSDPLKRKSFTPNELNGYSGMTDTTVSERSAAFKAAARKVILTNRVSLIPSLRVEEKGKRILREEWIKNNSPHCSPTKQKKGLTEPLTDDINCQILDFGHERDEEHSQRMYEYPREHSNPKEHSSSTARIELDTFSFGKVSSLQSKFITPENFNENSNDENRKESQVRSEMNLLVKNVKVAERASNYNIIPNKTDTLDSNSIDYYSENERKESHIHSEMISLVANVKVAERASNYNIIPRNDRNEGIDKDRRECVQRLPNGKYYLVPFFVCFYFYSFIC